MTIRLPNPIANTMTEAYLAYKAGVLPEEDIKPKLYYPVQHFDAWLAYWCGFVDTYPTDADGNPEMLCDEEAFVAYLSGVTDTYPEEIKDPYEVRRVGYLRAMVSSDYTAPDYPVNNEELYLSMITPAVSNPTPSSSFTLKGTGEGPFEFVEVYGDIYQQANPNPDNPINPDVVTGDQVVNISGKNLYYLEEGVNTFTSAALLIDVTFGLNEVTVEATTDRNGAQYAGGIIASELDPDKTYVISGEVEKLVGTHGYQLYRWYSDDGTTWQGSTRLLGGELEEGEKVKFSATVTGHAYYRFAFWNANGTTKTGIGEKTHYYNLQVEEGTEPTSFAPYKAPVQYPLSLGSIRLLKMGDYSDKIYQDDEGDWYIHKAINIATFDGSPDEDWYKENTGNPNFMYCLDNAISDLVYVSDSEGFMCNIEVPAIINSSTTNDGVSLTSSGSIRFRYYPEVSLEEIKAFLAYQNLDIYYATTNPVDTKITDTTLISQLNALKEGGSYKGDTIVLVTNSGEYLTALLKLSATSS